MRLLGCKFCCLELDRFCHRKLLGCKASEGSTRQLHSLLLMVMDWMNFMIVFPLLSLKSMTRKCLLCKI
jgi:hypothetical protein